MHDKLIQAAREVLGEYVSYCRLDELGQERDGHGNVCSVYLDERRRPMVRIVGGGKTLNVDPVSINLTPEERSAYFVSAREVRERTDAINHELNTERLLGEQVIDALQDAYLGPAIVLQAAPEEPKEEEREHSN